MQAAQRDGVVDSHEVLKILAVETGVRTQFV